MTTITVRLPNSDHEVDVSVKLLGYSGDGFHEPRTLEFDDAVYTWSKTRRVIKQDCINAKVEDLWSLDDIKEEAEDEEAEPDYDDYDPDDRDDSRDP